MTRSLPTPLLTFLVVSLVVVIGGIATVGIWGAGDEEPVETAEPRTVEQMEADQGYVAPPTTETDTTDLDAVRSIKLMLGADATVRDEVIVIYAESVCGAARERESNTGFELAVALVGLEELPSRTTTQHLIAAKSALEWHCPAEHDRLYG